MTVALEKECTPPVAGPTAVTTDEPGTVRYDRVPSEDGSRLVRSYTFPGGCGTYDFRITEPTPSVVVEASLAVGFITRSEVEARYYGRP